MFKRGLKNYFVNLKYVFTPIGTFAFGVMIGLSILIPGTVAAIRALADTVAEISGNTSIDFGALWDCLTDAVAALDWNEPMNALHTVVQREWLMQTFSDCVHSLIAGGEVAAEQITAAVETAIGSLVVGFVFLMLFAVLGIVGGVFLTKWLVRRAIAKRAWWKYFAATLIDAVLATGLLLAVAWLQSVWGGGIVVGGVVSWLLVSFFSLTEAYLLHGYKKIPWKETVTVKNVGMLLLADLTIMGIACVFSVLGVLLTGAVAGLCLALSLIGIAVIVMNLNAESYVLGEVAARTAQAIPDAAAETSESAVYDNEAK